MIEIQIPGNGTEIDIDTTFISTHEVLPPITLADCDPDQMLNVDLIEKRVILSI